MYTITHSSCNCKSQAETSDMACLNEKLNEGHELLNAQHETSEQVKQT